MATSVETCKGRPPDLEVVLDALLRSLAKHYEALRQSSGPATIIREWSARSSYAEAKRVSVGEASDSFVGTTRGLEPDGALRIETDDGEITELLRAGDVRFSAACRHRPYEARMFNLSDESAPPGGESSGSIAPGKCTRDRSDR